METAEKFQGWSNHATWVVNLWLTNTRSAYDMLQSIITDGSDSDFKKAVKLENRVLKAIVDADLYENGRLIPVDSQGNNWPVGIVNDLIDGEDKLTNVNWLEIIQSNYEQ